MLTHRIAYMLLERDILPWHIMAVTFTNKAASEMRERVERLVGQQARNLWLGTFHSMCARILRREVEATPYKPNFAIYDTGDQKTLIKTIITEMNKDPKQHQPSRVLSAISAAKTNSSPRRNIQRWPIRMRSCAKPTAAIRKIAHQ
ncbi:MAG: UvrD-helicase domain-containing protein [Anaerolineae bacterium]|nr:UvrD-helicase domain-containing protein [Anaerolineae bacterium]